MRDSTLDKLPFSAAAHSCCPNSLFCLPFILYSLQFTFSSLFSSLSSYFRCPSHSTNTANDPVTRPTNTTVSNENRGLQRHLLPINRQHSCAQQLLQKIKVAWDARAREDFIIHNLQRRYLQFQGGVRLRYEIMLKNITTQTRHIQLPNGQPQRLLYPPPCSCPAAVPTTLKTFVSLIPPPLSNSTQQTNRSRFRHGFVMVLVWLSHGFTNTGHRSSTNVPGHGSATGPLTLHSMVPLRYNHCVAPARVHLYCIAPPWRPWTRYDTCVAPALVHHGSAL
jgi:hypothetical protein